MRMRVERGRSRRSLLPWLTALALVAGSVLGISSIGLRSFGIARADGGCPVVTPLQQEIFVSATTGSDTNAGTETDPLQTLPAAQALVRTINSNMTGNIEVCLESGIYRLSAPLNFSPVDSGSNGNQIIWTSNSDDPATIAGSVPVTGWSEVNTSKHIWAASVPAYVRTRQIYVDGARATLDSGAVRGTVVERGFGYQLFPDPFASWPDASGMDFGYLAALGLWTNPICPIAKVKSADITMAEPCWKNATQRADNFVGWGNLTRPTYVENAMELLGKPGQFYLDDKSNMLYYVPRAGQDMHTADVEAPFLQSLVEGSGTKTDAVQNLTFENIDFSYATWMRPSEPDGLSEVQANYSLTGSNAGKVQGLCHYAPKGTCPYGAWTQTPGNVEFSYDQNLTFSNDRFFHLGGAGLDLNDGSQHDTVVGSVFTDISGNGIEVGNVDIPKAAGSSQTSYVTLEDNYLYGLPVEYQGGCPIIVGYAAHTLVTHNEIDNAPYSGISIGWGGWPDKYGHPTEPNFSVDNTISDNIVANFMQLLSDGGGIYTQGITGHSMATGELVTGNIVHDELDWSRALQSDDGATYDTYSDNVLYDNSYDWGTNHTDFSSGSDYGSNDPTLLENNYWQQGDPNTSHRLFVEHDNTVISGPSQAPKALVENAGLEPAYQYLLSWQPSTFPIPPNAPQRLKVLYAFKGQVYLTWRPGFAFGTDPPTVYSVQACKVNSASYAGGCGQAVGSPVTVSASDFDNLGYVVIPGLKDGTTYSFAVTESSAAGSSTPSIASDPVKPVNATPPLSGHPKHVVARQGMGAISLQWYAPGTARARYYQFASQPILSYVVSVCTGVTTCTPQDAIEQETSSSLAQVITSNGGSKTVFMVTGLTAGQSYKFAVQAQTPQGLGKPAYSGWIKPLADPGGS